MDYMDEGLNTCFVEDPYSLKLLPVVSTLSPSAAEGVVTFGKVYRRIPGTYEASIVTCGLGKCMFFALLIPTCCCTAPIRGQHKAHRFIQRLAINNFAFMPQYSSHWHDSKP